MSERRKFTRWQINRQAKFRLEQAVKEVFCQVKDINYKGAQVVLNVNLPEDAAFRLNLRLSETCNFDAEVWVAWRKIVDGVNHYGLYFSKIKDANKEKIYNFICTYYPNDLKEKWWVTEQTAESRQDHRIFERFPVHYPVRFLNLDSGNEGAGKTVNVSAKGLGLATDKKLNLHTSLEIWLQMPDKGEPLYIRGKVAWIKAEGLANYHFGVELENAALMGISRFLRT